MNKFVIIFTLITAGIFQGCSPGKTSDDSTQSGELQLKDIRLETLEGDAIDLAGYKGKVIFINFWATWCKPCLQEMPSIQKAMEEVGPERAVFLFPSNETVEQIQNFKENRDFPFTYVRVTNLESLNFYALPATIIFNANGKLVFSEAGMKDWADTENIDLILSAESAE